MEIKFYFDDAEHPLMTIEMKITYFVMCTYTNKPRHWRMAKNMTMMMMMKNTYVKKTLKFITSYLPRKMCQQSVEFINFFSFVLILNWHAKEHNRWVWVWNCIMLVVPKKISEKRAGLRLMPKWTTTKKESRLMSASVETRLMRVKCKSIFAHFMCKMNVIHKI